MEHIVHVDEMAETIISEPSEKGAGIQHIMVGDLQLGLGEGGYSKICSI